MNFQQVAGISGLVHLNTVKRPAAVPSRERHAWSCIPGWGQQATCQKCGCVKYHSRLDYSTHYTLPGQPSQTRRPACTDSRP